ncbi:MAG: RluA family pseudouridine synthase [Eubacteriales bacterium]|nr:RluA family pseudouridine synthase [Eubacteriales bacterium]
MLKTLRAEADAGRLDTYLAREFPDYSRSQLRKYFDAGEILVNGEQVKPSYKVQAGDAIEVKLEPLQRESLPEEEDIPLDILYEDEDLLVVNKPRGLVVHPAVGHSSGTLVNALLYHAGHDLSSLGGEFRPGIVHRLDKDTSGALLVAKNDRMHWLLAELFKDRAVEREYHALVWGKPQSRAGLIDAPIGRDPNNRQRMAVTPKGKPALTHFETLEEFARTSELALRLETGRTHQIRVHLQYIGNPVIGDQIYAPKRLSPGFEGQALHAYRLAFTDPRDGSWREFVAPLPEDYLSLRQELRQML